MYIRFEIQTSKTNVWDKTEASIVDQLDVPLPHGEPEEKNLWPVYLKVKDTLGGLMRELLEAELAKRHNNPDFGFTVQARKPVVYPPLSEPKAKARRNTLPKDPIASKG